jgi:hypothetical protein
MEEVMGNIYDELSTVELLKAAETMCRVLDGVQRDDGTISEEDSAILDAIIERFDENHAAPGYKEMEDD